MRILNGHEDFQVAHFKVPVARECCISVSSRVFVGVRKACVPIIHVAVIRNTNVVTTTKAGSLVLLVEYRILRIFVLVLCRHAGWIRQREYKRWCIWLPVALRLPGKWSPPAEQIAAIRRLNNAQVFALPVARLVEILRSESITTCFVNELPFLHYSNPLIKPFLVLTWKKNWFIEIPRTYNMETSRNEFDVIFPIHD